MSNNISFSFNNLVVKATGVLVVKMAKPLLVFGGSAAIKSAIFLWKNSPTMSQVMNVTASVLNFGFVSISFWLGCVLSSSTFSCAGPNPPNSNRITDHAPFLYRSMLTFHGIRGLMNLPWSSMVAVASAVTKFCIKQSIATVRAIVQSEVVRSAGMQIARGLSNVVLPAAALFGRHALTKCSNAIKASVGIAQGLVRVSNAHSLASQPEQLSSQLSVLPSKAVTLAQRQQELKKGAQEIKAIFRQVRAAQQAAIQARRQTRLRCHK